MWWGINVNIKNLNLNWKKCRESGVRVSFESGKSQRCHLELCLDLGQVNIGLSCQVHNLADS